MAEQCTLWCQHRTQRRCQLECHTQWGSCRPSLLVHGRRDLIACLDSVIRPTLYGLGDCDNMCYNPVWNYQACHSVKLHVYSLYYSRRPSKCDLKYLSAVFAASERFSWPRPSNTIAMLRHAILFAITQQSCAPLTITCTHGIMSLPTCLWNHRSLSLQQLSCWRILMGRVFFVSCKLLKTRALSCQLLQCANIW